MSFSRVKNFILGSAYVVSASLGDALLFQNLVNFVVIGSNSTYWLYLVIGFALAAVVNSLLWLTALANSAKLADEHITQHGHEMTENNKHNHGAAHCTHVHDWKHALKEFAFIGGPFALISIAGFQEFCEVLPIIQNPLLWWTCALAAALFTAIGSKWVHEYNLHQSSNHSDKNLTQFKSTVEEKDIGLFRRLSFQEISILVSHFLEGFLAGSLFLEALGLQAILLGIAPIIPLALSVTLGIAVAWAEGVSESVAMWRYHANSNEAKQSKRSYFDAGWVWFCSFWHSLAPVLSAVTLIEPLLPTPPRTVVRVAWFAASVFVVGLPNTEGFFRTVADDALELSPQTSSPQA